MQYQLDNDELIIPDGAIGTELKRLDASTHEAIWCAEALEYHTPDTYWIEAKSWVAEGAKIIGRCCGTTPEHIQALRNGLC